MQKTAEAVSLGHPDKIADYISSYILDRMIEQDSHVKYATEVMIKDNTVALGGEITGHVSVDNLGGVYRGRTGRNRIQSRICRAMGRAHNQPRQNKNHQYDWRAIARHQSWGCL